MYRHRTANTRGLNRDQTNQEHRWKQRSDNYKMRKQGAGQENETTQAHGTNKRPCACTQNTGLSWFCLKTKENHGHECRIMTMSWYTASFAYRRDIWSCGLWSKTFHLQAEKTPQWGWGKGSKGQGKWTSSSDGRQTRLWIDGNGGMPHCPIFESSSNLPGLLHLSTCSHPHHTWYLPRQGILGRIFYSNMPYPPLAVFSCDVLVYSIFCIQEEHLVLWTMGKNLSSPGWENSSMGLRKGK